jgi:uncharacterized membrane protein
VAIIQAMSPSTYHFLHIVGLILLFVGFGGIAGGDNGSRRKAMMYHGIGLLVLLISGFGSIASTRKADPTSPVSYGSPFVLVMLIVWLALGALPVLAKRGVLPPRTVILIGTALGAVAAYCGYFKFPGL